MFYRKIDKKGFSLIELLIVVAIIGILSSVILVSFQSSRAKGRDAKRIADIRSIQTALALYADSNTGHYPPEATVFTALVNGKFLADEPVAPNVGEEYSYAIPGDGLSYHLGTTLEQVGLSNSILVGDADCSSVVAPPYPSDPPLCRGFTAAVASGFDGTDALTTPCQIGKGQSTGPKAVCYDVTP